MAATHKQLQRQGAATALPNSLLPGDGKAVGSAQASGIPSETAEVARPTTGNAAGVGAPAAVITEGQSQATRTLGPNHSAARIT